MSDPNVRTGPGGEEIVLEPGDEGYIDPQIAGPPTSDPTIPPTGDGPPPPPDSGTYLNPDLPVAQMAEDVVAPQDLRLQSAEGQDASEAIVMNRGVVVDSQNATDLVPNTPQITMGTPEPVMDDKAQEEAEAEAEAEAKAQAEAFDAAQAESTEEPASA